MSELPQWMLNIISMAAPLFTGVGGVLFARWRYIRNRQFSTVNDKKRIDTMAQIITLEKNQPDQVNVIRALYASIGMHFTNELNRYTLDYINEKGLPYDHSELNHFLKSARLLDIDTVRNRYEFNGTKSFLRQIELWAVFAAVTAILIPAAFVAFKATPTVKDTWEIAGYTVFVLFLGVWTSLYFGFVSQLQHCISTKSFYKKFGPWLQQRIADDKQVEHTEP